MDYESLVEVEQILDELSKYEYSQVKPRVNKLKELLKPGIEAERRRHYRVNNNLKSSVDRDIVQELTQAQNVINGVRTMNKRAYDEVGYHDKATNDLLHALELLDDDSELVEYTKELRDTRKMRREAKDFLDVVNPVVTFVNRNPEAMKDLNKAIDDTRINKEKQANRTYTPRVKTEMEVALEKAMSNKE